MNTFRTVLLVPVVLAGLVVTPVRADEVTDWNRILFSAAMVGGTGPGAIPRFAAIVQASVFDAVNGVERRYTSIHVPPAAPAGASAEAAAVGAAYTALVGLYPAQKSTFDARLAVSLAEIGTRASTAAMSSGLLWGQHVAGLILAWRGTDGLTPAPPPFLGGTAAGQWRPTPPGFAPGASPQLATMTPWVLQTPAQFRPAGPPALGSAQYARELNETKTMGSLSSTTRTSDQTVLSWFWASGTATYMWNRVALSLIEQPRRASDDIDIDGHHGSRSTTVENARVFAHLNLAIADSTIGCWDAKYTFVFWRPVTAIALADTDGNAATTADLAWTPLLATPPHPDYPSGHSCFSGAAAEVLGAYFGSRTHFTVESDLMPGVVRSFDGFSAALEEVGNARIFAGIHFRSAVEDGQTLGAAVARYVLTTAMQPLDGGH
jgi:hypothetical protein